jgi:GT2 family glycosyltransferase
VDEPLVSVVVPTYNRAPSLRRLLAALQEAQVPAGGVEVVVVDDGSSDDTGEVVRTAGPPFRYVRQDNRGPAAARNRGWAAARGEIVAFTDDDTVPDRRWLVDLVEWFEAHPEAGAVGGAIQPLRSGFLADFVQLDRLVGHGADQRGVRFLVTANAAFRRWALERVGGFDESFATPAAEDTDLSFRLRAAGVPLHTCAGAVVLHDHRTTLGELVETYFKHGRGFQALARSHPGIGAGPARTLATPAHWWGRYRRYRDEGPMGRARSLAYVGLRVVGLASFAGGVLAARRSPAPGG